MITGGAERILINYLNLLSSVENLNITLLLLENKGENNINIEEINKNINIQFILNTEESKKYAKSENEIYVNRVI